jgi:hypothetical protein
LIKYTDDSWYAKAGFEPNDYINAWAPFWGKYSYHIGVIIKYITRFLFKNGREDLLKAKFFIERLLEFWDIQEENKKEITPELRMKDDYIRSSHYWCSYCDFYCLVEDDMILHISQEHHLDPYDDIIVFKEKTIVSTEEDLLSKIKKDGLKDYKCYYCDFSSNDQVEVSWHIDKEHDLKGETPIIVDRRYNKEKIEHE